MPLSPLLLVVALTISLKSWPRTMVRSVYNGDFCARVTPAFKVETGKHTAATRLQWKWFINWASVWKMTMLMRCLHELQLLMTSTASADGSQNSKAMRDMMCQLGVTARFTFHIWQHSKLCAVKQSWKRQLLKATWQSITVCYSSSSKGTAPSSGLGHTKGADIYAGKTLYTLKQANKYPSKQ